MIQYQLMPAIMFISRFCQKLGFHPGLLIAGDHSIDGSKIFAVSFPTGRAGQPAGSSYILAGLSANGCMADSARVNWWNLNSDKLCILSDVRDSYLAAPTLPSFPGDVHAPADKKVAQ